MEWNYISGNHRQPYWVRITLKISGGQDPKEFIKFSWPRPLDFDIRE
jgi:hypothetical protein